MFMQVAIGAIGIGITVMIGYIIISQVRTSLPTPQATYVNSCQGYPLNDTTNCNTTAVNCGPISDNVSDTISCDNAGFTEGISGAQTTIFAGFGLVAVGIIILAAFGLINVFR